MGFILLAYVFGPQGQTVYKGSMHKDSTTDAFGH